MQVRTGYEQVIPHRVSDMYAYMAKDSGKVISIDQHAILIEYKSGERVGVQIGRRYGNAAGLTIPHEIITPLKVGDSFKVGAPIAYNQGFFEPDWLDPKQIVWKSSIGVKTAILESSDTHEDSSAISSKLALDLSTKITKVRTIVINFEQQIHRLVKIKDEVDFDTALCLIEDPVSASNHLLDEKTIDTLKVLTAQTPQAKLRGIIERVEVYYHGEKEDMSSTLRALTDVSDKQLATRLKSQGKKPFTGSVGENFRVENDPLPLDSAAIRIYITTDVGATLGDKGVFGNQLKSIFGRIYQNNIETESGVPIDAIFGAKSIDDRIVLSPYIIGTTTTLLNVIAKRAITAYEG